MTKPPKAPPLTAKELRVFRRLRAELKARGLWRSTEAKRVELCACFLNAQIETVRDLRALPSVSPEFAEAVRSAHHAARAWLARLGLLDKRGVWPPPHTGDGEDPDLLAYTEPPQ